MKKPFPCIECKGHEFIQGTHVHELICMQCGFANKLVFYDCESKHCCPQGFPTCPRCYTGKGTNTLCRD